MTYRESLGQIRGVLGFAGFLILIYAIERLTATLLGFPNERLMLEMLSVEQKRLLVLTIGPFVHRGVSHIAENLVFLLIFGGYIEWQVGWRKLYLYCAATGYGASWILLVIIGGAGAVGASSITNGLEAVAGIVGFVRVVEELRNVNSGADILRGVSHVIPFVIGLGFAASTIQAATMSPTDATQAIHAIGALIGVIAATYYPLTQLGTGGMFSEVLS
ncbi:rhomboid family intramembrane serine protease [Haloferax volcanii]|nr:rhomboid family intramembrane serine protease [Haloferax volcanii]MDW7539485.1 rhomboid family intramembrane serine protease [Haloferax volcanii]